jgi:hypothetical protein
MPQDEMFNKIYSQAQDYAAQVRGQLPTAPVAPTISQDISQLQGINETLAQGDRNKGMVTGMEGQAQNEYAWEEMARKQAAATKAAAKPKKVPKSDGGFDFFDANGAPISAYDYARIEGTDIASVLGDSMNPDDQALIADYAGLKDFWDASQKLASRGKIDTSKFKVDTDSEGNEALLDESGNVIKKDDPRMTYYLYTLENPTLKNMTLDETRKAFMKKWSRAYFADPNYKPSY